uniref:Opsin 7, group member a n=1 Tax=Salmo trutta TaxID=8032 RepID=A0A673XLR6_SALTR
MGVCSLVGNTILLYVSYNKKMLLKPAEFFIINLAVSDLGMTLSLYPLAVTSSIYHRLTVCLVYAFCGVLFGICSLTTLTILSTVCCLKVCYPLYGNRFSPDHGRFLIACAWAYALVFPYGTACCIDWSYTVALFLCCYILPCCVITSAYSQILVTVRESRRAVEQHVSQQTRMGNVQTTIVKLSVAVCIGFFAAWSPYALVSMWASFGHMDSIPPMAFAIPAVLAKSSTLYNPLVYLLLKPNFRHLLSKDLHSLHRACVLQCQHDAATPVGWCSSACKHPPFSSKHNDGHYGQTVPFFFHQTRGHVSKKYDLCPHVQLQTVICFFMAVLEQWLLPCCGYRYFCTCFLQHLHKVLCCCSGINLHFSHQSTFISRRQNASPS